MATKWISPTWRMPDEQNQSNFENYSLSFDGAVREDIQLGTTTFLLPGQPSSTSTSVSNPKFSTSIFFNFNSSVAGTTVYMIGAGQAGGATYWYLRKDSNDNLQASFRITNGAYATITGGTTLSHSTWYHACVTWDGDNINLYLNGVSDATQVAATTFYYSSTISHPTIGSFRYSASATSNEWEGKLSQATVFDYALSQSQINYLYNSGTPVNPMAISGNAPIAYYPLGGSSTGSASTLTTPNDSVPSATVFDFLAAPTYSRISLGTTSFTGNKTISFWLNKGSNNGTVLGFGNTNYYPNVQSTTLQLNNGSTTILSTGTINLNEWNHYVITGDGTTAKCYVNGVYKSTGTDRDISSGATWIGGQNNGTGMLLGKLSNVQQWETVLTDGGVSIGDAATGEVAQIYNNGVPYTGTQPQAANLRAWYPMDVSNANWEADTSNNWQIADAVSSYPQSFDFAPNKTITTTNPFSSIVTGSNVIGTCTISYWLKVAGGSQQSFMELVNSTTHTAGFRIDSNNKPYYINSQGGRYKRFAALSNPSNWNHWCWIFPSDTSYADAKLYINGIEKSVDFDFSAAPANNAWDGFYINKYQTSSSATFKMSNLQLWSGNLTEPQITELYNNGVPLTSAIATSNLKAWYKLNYTSNWNSTTDHWYIPNSGLTINYSSALKFIPKSDGSGNALTIYQGTDGNGPANLKFGATDSFSISTWVYVENKNSSGYIFTARGSFATGAKSFNRLYINTLGASRSDQQVTWAVRDDNQVSASVSSTLSTSGHPEDFNWTHVVAVVNRSTQTIQLFVNGKGSSTASISSLGSFENQDSIVIANDGYTAIGGRSYYDGQLSNFAIFGSALSQSQINTLYNNGTPEASISNSPISWWKLNNLTTGIEDSAGGGNNITAASWITQVSNYVSVKAMSSGMTEQNLVNNNVSTLNGTSSGMTTANLVNSDLTRSIPYSSYSFNFDSASSDYIVVDNSSGVFNFGTNPFSISLWFNGTTFPGTYTAVLGSHGSGSNSSFWAVYVHDSNGVFIFGNGGELIGGGGSISTNEWYHYAATRDTSGNLITYLNGVAVNTATGKTGTFDSSSAIRIADDLHNSNPSFDGKISNCSIYSSALTEDQILTIYNGGVPNDISSLSPVGWWSLAGDSYYNGTNFTCPDLSSNSNNGTSSSMGGTELVGDGPGSTANGIATSMNIPENLQGNAPNSTKNAFSINMTETDRETNVPS